VRLVSTVFHDEKEMLASVAGLGIIAVTMKIWLLVVCLATVPASASQPWTWKDADGAVRTQAEFDKLVLANTQWVDSKGKLGEQADFSNTDLHGLNLAGKDLRGVDLTQANLCGADLSNTKLNEAYLGGSDPKSPGARLCGTVLVGADLTDADFTNADLSNANLNSADMTRTQIDHTNLEGANYEPRTGPDLSSLVFALNLGGLVYRNDPGPIMDLRNALETEGFEQLAREVNVAYHRHDESFLQKMLFDWPCDWGARPMRPLFMVAAMLVLSTLIYWIAMHLPQKGSGLFAYPTDDNDEASGTKEYPLRIRFGAERLMIVPGEHDHGSEMKDAPKNLAVKLWKYLGLEIEGVGIALLFGLMSVFAIGVEGFNGKQWIMMLQPRPFDIRARGWVRTVAGLQALLGAGLVALSLLSYFGHPFW
jgi:uncharacterized protein YjbI with pentapeptide repeats